MMIHQRMFRALRLQPLEVPRGKARLVLKTYYCVLHLLMLATPWRWILQQPGRRNDWAVWVYAEHWAIGEKLEGRI